MSLTKTNLGGMSQHEKEQLASCVKLLLLWVAASDGNVDDSELEFADSKFPGTDEEATTADLLAVIQRADLKSLEKAIRTVAEQSRELRTAFLDMAITMSMADREIAISENHILRFYADALYLGSTILDRRFKAISGEALPEPGDPAELEWWKKQGSNTGESGVGRTEVKAPAATGMTDIQARTMLCVGPDATQAELEHAYQNLTSIFQVQRVEVMGEAAVAVANKRLKRIKEAYELLRN